MDTAGEQVKPKDARLESLVVSAKKNLGDKLRALKAHDFEFPEGHEAHGDTPFNSSEDALEDICWATREDDNLYEFLLESGEKVPISDKVFVTVARAPSARKITDRQALSLDDTKDPRISVIELNYQNREGSSPDLIQYASFSPNGKMQDVSRGDLARAVKRFSALLRNHREEKTLKELSGLSRNSVREKFISAMRVEKPLPQKI